MDSDNCFHGAPDPYNITFSSTPIKGRRKRYLLRLINTSFESTFIFAIDNHELQVVSTDFVAIKPYSTRSVTIGIGQRYNVIVNAQPIDETGKPILGIEKNGFWMRTWWPKCFRFPQPTGQFYEQSGILLYDNFNTAPKPGPPPAGWSVDTTVCTDEPYEKLTPRFSWQVPRPNITELTGRLADNFTVNIAPDNTYYFPLSLFSMGGDKFNPFYIDYGNPIFLNLQYGGEWPPRWVVYREPHPGLGQEWVSGPLSNVMHHCAMASRGVQMKLVSFLLIVDATGLSYHQERYRTTSGEQVCLRSFFLSLTDIFSRYTCMVTTLSFCSKMLLWKASRTTSHSIPIIHPGAM